MAKSALAAQEDKSDNLVLSPYNALTAMALVGTGAATTTLEEFAKTLFETGGDAMPAAVTQFTQLNTDLLAANKGHVDLLTANGIWVNKDVATLSDVYEKKATDIFGASISREDFTDKATVDKINTWASENTKGLISKVIKELHREDAIVLASALYFKGEWTHKFDKADTKDKTFTADGGKAFTTKMMSKSFDEGDIRWQERDGYEAAALTYGTEDFENNKYPTMRIVLVRPKDAKVSARDWLAGVDKAEWLDANAFESVRGLVELPHLDIKQHHDLIPVLLGMGIKSAFEQNADFRLMVDAKTAPLYISGVSHDVVFKTDEQGSEAAAVTTMTMAGSAMHQEPKTVSLKLDRSFVFALQDIRSGTVLFLGAVNKPNEEMK